MVSALRVCDNSINMEETREMGTHMAIGTFRQEIGNIFRRESLVTKAVGAA
jgi:ABC-type antimicrobial peptide transport system permease subunit